MARRAFVVVLDACGAGELPDSGDYGDAGADTLVHVAEGAGGLHVPNLGSLGLGLVRDLLGVPPAAAPGAVHGRLHPLGPGKDTISGHWELMGVITPEPMRTYPDGFPDDVLRALRSAWGRDVLGNVAASGTEIIERLGPEMVATGKPIVYTSADSVLQVAAHEDVIAPDELHRMCEAARAIMTGEHAVGRVIARPFEGTPGDYHRTPRRHDYALTPPARSYLDALRDAGVLTHAVGKVRDVFDGVGVDHTHPGASNPEAIASLDALVRELDGGMVFANLVDTDQRYGHRKDVPGFAAALEAFDGALGRWLEVLDPARDLLVVTADHGVDPAHPGTDHTREHVPLLARFRGHGGRRHDGPMADVGASCLAWLSGAPEPGLPGASFTV